MIDIKDIVDDTKWLSVIGMLRGALLAYAIPISLHIFPHLFSITQNISVYSAYEQSDFCGSICDMYLRVHKIMPVKSTQEQMENIVRGSNLTREDGNAEMVQTKSRPFAVTLLYILLIFLGVGATGGGGVLVVDPSGELMKMPTSMLVRSPFSDFLIPGILLLIIFGLLPLLVLYGLIQRPQWAWADALNPFKVIYSFWALSLYIGFGQIIWIMVQTYMLNSVGIIHLIYMSLGLLIQAVTLLPSVQRYYLLDEDVKRR